MNEHARRTVRDLQRELESHYDAIGTIERTLRGLRAQFGISEEDDFDDLDDDQPVLSENDLSPSAAVARQRKTKRRKKVKRVAPPASASRRVKQPARLTDDAGEQKVIAALVAARDPQSKKQLMKRTGVSDWLMRKAIQSLVDAGQVVTTGSRSTYRVSLKSRATKEGL